MNQVFLEERSREKINDLMDEGLRSQEYSRNRARKPNLLHRIGKSVATILENLVQHSLSKGKRYSSFRQRGVMK